MRRPGSLAEVATEARSLRDFGSALVEFLDQFYSERRPEMIVDEPSLLRERLQDEGLADAYLGAVAVQLSRSVGQPPPAWASRSARFLRRPWFANSGASLRATLLLESPAAFRERNLFVSENALHRA